MTHPRARFSLAVLLLLGVAFAAIRLADRHDRVADWTSNARFTPDWVTRAVLSDFPGEVRATAFRMPGQDPAAAAALRLRLEAFRRASPKFDFRFVDPLAFPAAASGFPIPADLGVVLESGDVREVVTDADEAGLVSGLLRLARRGKRPVFFLGGHGERSIRDTSPDGFSGVAQELRQAGLVPRDTLWMRDDAAGAGDGNSPGPSLDADESVEPLWVLAGPRTDLFPEEREQLSAHLARGGAALVLLDPRELPRIESLLEEWGVTTGRGVLVDPTTRLYGADATVPVVTDYARHPVTAALTRGGTVPTFFPVARGLRAASSEERRLRVEIVASASGRAREQAIGNGTPTTRPRVAGETPWGLVLAVEEPDGARLVVIGDSDFATNGNLSLSGNAALFAGAVEWLVAGGEALPVRPASDDPPLLLTERQFLRRVTLPSLALPVLALILGVAAARKGRLS